MSQLPSYRPIDPRRSARRASWMMIALAVAALAIGGLAALMALAWPEFRNRPDAREAVEQIERLGVDVVTYFYAIAVTMAAYGLLNLVIGIFVRRGTRGRIVAAMTLTGVALLILGVNLLGSFSLGNPPAVVFCLLITAAHAVQLNWLRQAWQNANVLDRHPPRATHGVDPAFPLLAPPPAPMAGYYAELPPASTPRTSSSAAPGED